MIRIIMIKTVAGVSPRISFSMWVCFIFWRFLILPFLA
uniref:Uncharacterized protein n=1 Tax=Rhizophora mucronata TaxID=61149 RepID=A0A2P2PUT3_RHIMU